MRDFYKILGVERGADDGTITKAYKALAKRLHPDVNPSAGSGSGTDGATASDDLRDVIEAYKVLSKPDERAAYDTAWIEGRVGLRRRILLVAVLTMAGTITIASLSIAYHWRTELIAERQQLHERTALLRRTEEDRQPPKIRHEERKTLPKRAQPAAPPAPQTSSPLSELPSVSESTSDLVRLPAPTFANSPMSSELEPITGPLRIARALPALSGLKASEVIRFATVEVSEAEPASSRREDDHGTDVEFSDQPVERRSRPTKKTADATKTLPLPSRPPADLPTVEQFSLTRQEAAALIQNKYLSSRRRDRRSLIDLYCFRVDYWGDKALPRSSVINQISDFVSRWPYRAYKLKPGSLEFTPTGRPSSYKAEFNYQFRVASHQYYGGTAGLARARLIIERQHGRWRICKEEGQVVKRHSPSPVWGSKGYPKHASGHPMDTHRILFGE